MSKYVVYTPKIKVGRTTHQTMKISVPFIVYWIFLPFLNFLLWFFISHSGLITKWLCSIEASVKSNGDVVKTQVMDGSLEAMLAKSKQTLSSESIISESAGCSENQFVPRDAYLNSESCKNNQVRGTANKFEVIFENTKEFDKFRAETLASMEVTMIVQTYTDADTMIFLYKGEDTPDNPYYRNANDRYDMYSCASYEHHFIEEKEGVCMAVIYSQNVNRSYHIARIDQDIDIYGLSISNPDPSQIDKYSSKFPLNEFNENKLWPTGFFRKVPKERGRERTKDKLGTFLTNFASIDAQLEEKLNRRQIVANDNLVVMVLNQGEMDLYMNFACSCRLHEISLANVIVFAGSPEIVPMIEATGAIAMYHEGFASVSKKASTDYLDRVFVDMMWYKAFSVYLILRRGINVLFQDVDLVWFREPFAYFSSYLEAHRARAEQTGVFTEAFFSDDGQRSKRYTPFYANSGFYYLLASERSEYFTWSIMIAMDAIQVLGSHQNVFTTRLIEGLALSYAQSKILSLQEFPTGIMYHHEQQYMKRLQRKEIQPYNFHMCWTQGKPDKLVYLRRAAMWYLTPQCSPLEALIQSGAAELEEELESSHGSAGEIYQLVDQLQRDGRSIDESWAELSGRCCMMMPNAP